MFNGLINKRSYRLQWVTGRARLCESLAQALVDAKRPLCGKSICRPWPLGNEYERARAKVRRVAWREHQAVRALRLLALEPQLVWASHELEQLRRCCRECPKVNCQRIRNGEAFACLLANGVQASPFRYHLNEKGQIVGR